jgi:hypothetical protein
MHSSVDDTRRLINAGKGCRAYSSVFFVTARRESHTRCIPTGYAAHQLADCSANWSRPSESPPTAGRARCAGGCADAAAKGTCSRFKSLCHSGCRAGPGTAVRLRVAHRARARPGSESAICCSAAHGAHRLLPAAAAAAAHAQQRTPLLFVSNSCGGSGPTRIIG